METYDSEEDLGDEYNEIRNKLKNSGLYDELDDLDKTYTQLKEIDEIPAYDEETGIRLGRFPLELRAFLRYQEALDNAKRKINSFESDSDLS